MSSTGGSVAIVDVDGRKGAEKAAELRADCASFACDVGDGEAVTACVERILARFIRVHILVNNAGVGPLAPAEELSEPAWDATLAVNLKGTFLMSQAVGRHMLTFGPYTMCCGS